MSLDRELANKFSLDNRVAVITGAGSGLGQESARVLALAGARLVLSDIDKKGLEKTAQLVKEAGSESISQVADIGHRTQVDALADAAAKAYGGIDIWLNSAGVSQISPILQTDEATSQKTVDVNMMGTFWGCAAAARHMQKSGRGAIINISSGGGTSPVPGLSVYAMTKAAVSHLTRIAAHEFGSSGIRVNAIAPAWIETQMGSSLFRKADGNIDEALREKVRAEQAASNPMGINGTAMDIALAVLYLASDASSFVNGQLLHVNGGSTG